MKRKPLSVERRQARAGWIFALPWLIGLVYFFIVPFVQSVWYSFNDVKIATDQQGLAYTFAGLSNYKYMLLKESTFNQSIVSTLTDLLYTVPVANVSNMWHITNSAISFSRIILPCFIWSLKVFAHGTRNTEIL